MVSPGGMGLSVQVGGRTQNFPAGHVVRIGRAGDVDVQVDSPLVSRLHASVSWSGSTWVFADNRSTNGVYVNGQRIQGPVPVSGSLTVRLGDPATGPMVTMIALAAQFPPVRPAAPTGDVLTVHASTTALPPVRQRSPQAPVSRPTGPIPAGGITIGRTPGNTIVVSDVLVSRRHARVVPTADGLIIEDVGSVNGTFVNGHRVASAPLREADTITVGNVDFVVQGGQLRQRERVVADAGLQTHGLGFTVEGNKQLLVDVSISAAPGTLTALIGPSGAGKSTLAKIIAGTNAPSIGVVSFGGHNLHAEYEALRSRIGMVPQDDVLHRQLTVRQALSYAAELRLPPDTSAADRDRVIDGVLAELSLTEHAGTRVDRLSGGQRKRASVALELLTSPSLLILDEPTSGLDPALDRQVMVMLRHLADAGRVVLVVTHSLTHLDMCDHVLLLAPGGKTAYWGHPKGVAAALGSSDWAEIFTVVAAEPDRVFAAYRARNPAGAPPQAVAASGAPRPRPTSGGKQMSTLVRRQLRLIFADRGYSVFLVAMPFLLGLLALVVPGDYGFDPSKPRCDPSAPTVDPIAVAQERCKSPGEAQQLLVLLFLSACFMGSALSVRDLVGERAIYLRERAVGLRSGAYLAAKIAVFALAACLQAAALVGMMLLFKHGPGTGVTGLPGSLELFLDVAATTVCCVVLGLLLSACARSSEQVMPLLVIVIVAQLVMCGGLIQVTGQPVVDQLSWLFPGRWGYASGASTVNLLGLFKAGESDWLWEHSAGQWFLCMGVLGVLGSAFAGLTLWRLRK